MGGARNSGKKMGGRQDDIGTPTKCLSLYEVVGKKKLWPLFLPRWKVDNERPTFEFLAESASLLSSCADVTKAEDPGKQRSEEKRILEHLFADPVLASLTDQALQGPCVI